MELNEWRPRRSSWKRCIWATGVPLPTIVDLDRRLVKAGLRNKAGRGLSAAHMTPLDAARLLTAILASPQSNQAADAVNRYTETRIDKARSSETLFAAANLDELTGLLARHGFVDALAALIASASTGVLAKLIAESKEDWTPHIEIYAFTRATRGRIRVAGLQSQLTASVEYVPAKKGGGIAADATGDLEQSRRITEHTIFSIANLLAEG